MTTDAPNQALNEEADEAARAMIQAARTPAIPPAPPEHVEGRSELRTSPEIDKIGDALAAAQLELQNPDKNRKVQINGRARGGGVARYEFEYATIDEVLNTVRPVLAKHKIAYTQVPTETETGTVLITRLIHAGQWIESCVRLGQLESMQGLGSAITYLKRYALCAMVGVAAEDDDDANITDGNKMARNGEQDLWTGPLNRTGLHNKIGDVARDIIACEDSDTLEAMLAHKSTIEVLEQCQRDRPSWYYSQEGSDVIGLEDHIKTKRRELEDADALRAPRAVS